MSMKLLCKTVMMGNIFSSVPVLLPGLRSSLAISSSKRLIFCCPWEKRTWEKSYCLFQAKSGQTEAGITKDISRNCIVKAPSPGITRLCKTLMVSWLILLKHGWKDNLEMRTKDWKAQGKQRELLGSLAESPDSGEGLWEYSERLFFSSSECFCEWFL